MVDSSFVAETELSGITHLFIGGDGTNGFLIGLRVSPWNIFMAELSIGQKLYGLFDGSETRLGLSIYPLAVAVSQKTSIYAGVGASYGVNSKILFLSPNAKVSLRIADQLSFSTMVGVYFASSTISPEHRFFYRESEGAKYNIGFSLGLLF